MKLEDLEGGGCATYAKNEIAILHPCNPSFGYQRQPSDMITSSSLLKEAPMSGGLVVLHLLIHPTEPHGSQAVWILDFPHALPWGSRVPEDHTP